MSYKDTNITNPGTSTRYGADDMEIIARLLNGTTSGPHPVKIKSTNKWGFWDSILYIRNQADTFDTTIRGAASQSNNFNLALPNLTANDTLAAIGLKNIWSVAQQLELGTLFKQQSAPSNPASNYHHLYVNASGQLVKRNSSGTEVIYDSLGVGSDAALRDYSARVFNTGGTYYATNSTGSVISQGSVFETVAQAALNIKGTVLFSGPTTLAASGSFSGLDIDEKTHVIVERGCTITVPAAYTGHCFRVLDKDRVIISIYGSLEEAGTPARNWTGIFFDSATMPIMNSHIVHAHVKNAANALRLRATGASAKIQANSFHMLNATDCKKTVLFEEVTGGSIDMNMFMDNVTNALAGVTTNGYNNVPGDMNEFYGCMFMDNSGTMVEMNILNTANNTAIIGGNIGMMGGATFVDASLTTVHFNAANALKIDSGFLRVKNPAGTFYTPITNAAQTGNFELAIPTLTENSTLVVLEKSQTFKQPLTIDCDGTSDVLDLKRDDNGIGNRVELDFQLDDNTGSTSNYARIAGEIQDNVAGSEDGILRFYVAIADVLSNCLTIDQTGALNLGGANARVKLTETGLTATRTYTFPDVSTMLAPLGDYASFTGGIESIADDEYLLDLTRDSSTLNVYWGIHYWAKDAGGGFEEYAQMLARLTDNTIGSHDGKLEFRVSFNGTMTERMGIFNDGHVDIITSTTNADGIYLYRPANTVNNSVELNFDHQDSLGNRDTYADIKARIIDNTSGSEDGRFEIHAVEAGSKYEMLRIEGGSATLRKQTNVDFDEQSFDFMMRDDLNNDTIYTAISAEIQDNTNATEDGTFNIDTMVGGTLQRVFSLNWDSDGALHCGGINRRIKLIQTGLTAVRTFTFPDITTKLAGLSSVNTFLDTQIIQDNSEEPLEIYRDSNTVNNLSGIILGAKNASSAYVPYGYLLTEIVANTAGSQTGALEFWVKNAGTSVRIAKLNQLGNLSIGPDASNSGPVTRNVIRSGTQLDLTNSTSEQTMFTQNILGGTMGNVGVLHLRLMGSIQQNQATATNFTLRIKFGGTTIFNDIVGNALAQSANFLPYILDIYVFNTGSASTNSMNGFFMLNDTGVPTTGIGDLTDDETQSNGPIGAAASPNINTANNATLEVTMQASVASTSIHTYVDYRWLEINPST